MIRQHWTPLTLDIRSCVHGLNCCAPSSDVMAADKRGCTQAAGRMGPWKRQGFSLPSIQRQQMFITVLHVLCAFPSGLQLCSSSATLQPAVRQCLIWFPSALRGNSCSLERTRNTRCSRAGSSLRRNAAVLTPIHASPGWKPGEICTDCRF